jgi:hypothetical protein
MEITGKLVKILEPVTGEGKSGNPWKKQEFVLQTEEQYPKTICFSLWGDRSDLIMPYKENDAIKVHFSIESREFKGRYFTEVRAFRVDHTEKTNPQPTTGKPKENVMTEPPVFEEGNEKDDLPF